MISRSTRVLLGLSLLTGLCGAATAALAAGGLDGLDIRIGRALFNRAWVPAPSSTHADDGLGPLFDARSCASCHPDGRRARTIVTPDGQLDGRGMVLVLMQPGGTGDPVYGRRLQIDAVPGLTPEGILGVADKPLPDGRTARTPAPQQLGYGPLASATGLSLRVAQDLRGRGQLEQVSDAALEKLEAQQAKGPDAVHGRLRRVPAANGKTVIGRYGWKASQPTLASQSAEAFFLDMGMSTSFHPEPWGDCTPVQTACRNAPHGERGEGGLEIPDSVLDRVVAYVASLPTPDTEKDPGGARLFAATGCAACHQPALPSRQGGTVRLFTDLMLHDLGEGLADTLPDPGAKPSEWRTAPLAGLSDALARDTGLLHDGRAKSVEEAVLWHGGQAAGAVARFRALPAGQKAALLQYVSKL